MARLLSTKEAAEYLNLAKSTMYRMIKTGRIRVIKYSPKDYRFSLADLEAFVADNLWGPPAPTPPAPTPPAPTPLSFPPPDHLADLWRDFVDMRKAIRKPLTSGAGRLIVRKLERLYPNAPDMQRASLEQSIERGWQGVFEVIKDDQWGGKRPETREERKARLNAFAASLPEGGLE